MRAAQLPVLLRVVLLLVVVLLLLVVVLVRLPVGADNHLRTGPLAVAARPVLRGSFRRSRSSLSRSSS